MSKQNVPVKPPVVVDNPEDLIKDYDQYSDELVKGAIKVVAINKALREKRKKDRSIDLATPENKLVTASFKMKPSTQERLKDYVYTKNLNPARGEPKTSFMMAIDKAINLYIDDQVKHGLRLQTRPEELRMEDKTKSANMKYGKILSMIEKLEKKRPDGLLGYLRDAANEEKEK